MQDRGAWPRQLTRALTDCLDALDEGDVQAARELVDWSLSLATRVGQVALANAALVSGKVEQASGNPAAAKDAYIRAARLAARRLSDPDADQIYLHAQSQLAGLHRDGGEYKQAERILKQATATAVVHRIAARQDIAMLHEQLAVVSEHLGKPASPGGPLPPASAAHPAERPRVGPGTWGHGPAVLLLVRRHPKAGSGNQLLRSRPAR